MIDNDALDTIFFIIFIGAIFSTAIYFVAASAFSFGTFQECQQDQISVVELDPIPGNKCIDYQEKRDLILDRMTGLDLPATESTIAQVTPNTSEKVVAEVLERYQEESGNVYSTYDNGITYWNFYNKSQGDEQ